MMWARRLSDHRFAGHDNLDTYWHNSSKAPYIGYQNFVDRSDVNGGLDFGTMW